LCLASTARQIDRNRPEGFQIKILAQCLGRLLMGNLRKRIDQVGQSGALMVEE